MDLARLREMAGLPRARVAARAGVSDELARLFEANPDAVPAASRARLVAVYVELRERVSLELVDLLCRTEPVALAGVAVSPTPTLALVRGGLHR